MKNINLYRINNPINYNHLANNSTQKKSSDDKKLNFEDTLNNIGKHSVKISKHARDRMDKRNLRLEKEDLTRLEEALGKAEKKGVRDALIIMDKQSFIANVKSKTIITALSNDNLKENIFTNIDGAIMI